MRVRPVSFDYSDLRTRTNTGLSIRPVRGALELMYALRSHEGHFRQALRNEPPQPQPESVKLGRLSTRFKFAHSFRI